LPGTFPLLPIEKYPGYVVGFLVMGDTEGTPHIINPHGKDTDLSVYLTFDPYKSDYLVKDLGQAVDIIRHSMYRELLYNVVYCPVPGWDGDAPMVRERGVLRISRCPYRSK
jgi:hypothetical protein